jgi:hypothetical protein
MCELTFFHKSCMFLFYAPVQWAAERNIFGVGVNGSRRVMQARYGAGALWLLNGPVYTPTPKIFPCAAHCTGA